MIKKKFIACGSGIFVIILRSGINGFWKKKIQEKHAA